MEAGKALDAYGSMPGHDITQGDGKQAYAQAIMKGVDTWIRLPRNRWPKKWEKVYHDPVVRLVPALYGRPDSGGLWERHCEDGLKRVGFLAIRNVGHQCSGTRNSACARRIRRVDFGHPSKTTSYKVDGPRANSRVSFPRLCRRHIPAWRPQPLGTSQADSSPLSSRPIQRPTVTPT